MNHDTMIARAGDRSERWDIIVIGGGATGLGAAVDAASRGWRTLLLEQGDFAEATSSRSTKLIHGGLRYLREGNVGLVRESLRERGLLLKNAPHLVHPLAFVVPTYSHFETLFYGAGLKVYDALATGYGIGLSHLLSRAATLDRLPGLNPCGLRGGVLYFDAQFDDARLAITLAQTLAGLGGVALNHAGVVSLLKRDGKVRGVIARDSESGREFEIGSRVVVSATGVFSDAIRRMDEPDAPAMLTPSRGSHIVLDRSFLPGSTAVMVPKTEDGRVLFAIPWHDRVLVGTTDMPVKEVTAEPAPSEEEIDYLLKYAARYLAKAPRRTDILCAFAGLRPLVRTDGGKHTAKLPRDHVVRVSASGLVTIAGGKWTTFRKMGVDTVDCTAKVAGLAMQPSRTKELRLHGWTEGRADSVYGSDASSVALLATENAALNELLHPKLPYRACEVVWAVRHEMARTVEDVLSRRTRALLLDVRASIEIAPRVAKLMAHELGRDEGWIEEQVRKFTRLAEGCLVSGE